MTRRKKETAERRGRQMGPEKLKVCRLNEYQLHPDNAKWGEVLREAREMQGCTRMALGKATGLSRLAVRKIEGEGSRPLLESVLRIADVLGVPASVLALVVELRREGVTVSLEEAMQLRHLHRRNVLRRLFRGYFPRQGW